MPEVYTEQCGEQHISVPEQHIFFVLETALPDRTIRQICSAVRAVLKTLEKMDTNCAELCVGVLEYNTDARWSECKNNARKVDYLRDFVWENFSYRSGRNLGRALEVLSWDLSRHRKMESLSGNYRPIIIFMCDGHANDHLKRGLQILSENKWYRYALKIAFAVGWSPEVDVLEEIVTVDVPGAVVPAREEEDLSEAARIAVAAAVVGNLTACSYGPAVENREVSIVIMNEIVDALRQAGYEAVYHDKSGEDSANALRGVDMLQLDSSDDYDFGEFV